MVKGKKRSLFVMILTLMILSCVFAFVGCKDVTPTKTEYEVTFKVQENGEWKTHSVVKADEEGCVELPIVEASEGYVFRGWFLEDSFKTKFDGKNVKENTTVFALMSDKILTVSIRKNVDDVALLENLAVSDLDKIKEEHTALAAEKNLTFDGFYKDEECKTEYNKDSGVKKVYARYAVKVEFDNGYEVLKSELFDIGTVIDKPKAEEIANSYMDTKGLNYVDGNKQPINFENPVKVNTNIRVLWQTPGLKFVLPEGAETGVCIGAAFDKAEDSILFDSYPVVSIPGEAEINNQLVEITSAKIANITTSKSLKKIIINEGIKYIADVSASGVATKIEEIELPSTLVIIENSFNKLDCLKKVELPEGLEVILSSFWRDYEPKAGDIPGYDINIVVPSTVTNIARVPSNLDYTKNELFENDGDFVYKKDPVNGKTLVALSKMSIKNGSISIEEGVDAIQVGILQGLKYEYLTIPSTFKNVGYNADLAEYPYYSGQRLTDLSSVNEANIKPDGSKMDKYAYSIASGKINTYEKIIFNSNEYPKDVNKYAFIGFWAGDDSGLNVDGLKGKNKVIFLADIEEEKQLNINVDVINSMSGEKKSCKVSNYVSGQIVSEEEFLKTVKATEKDIGYSIKIDSIRFFGEDIDFSAPLRKNYSIEVKYSYAATGFTTEENLDGTLKVVGFDKNTAQKLDNGKYLIAIPNEINGKKITIIGDGAFKNNEEICQVFIADGITVIGNEAFKDTKNLSMVRVTPGNLAKIGDRAFEGAGATLKNNIYNVTNDLEGGQLDISFPIASLGKGLNVDERAIGANAFNTPSILDFQPVKGEEDKRKDPYSSSYESWVVGEYYYIGTSSGWGSVTTTFGIFKFTGSENIKVPQGDQEVDGVAYDIELYATAGGAGDQDTTMNIGFKSTMGQNDAIRVTLKEGSLCMYARDYQEITFINLKKAEKNAVSFINDFYVGSSVKLTHMPLTDGLLYTSQDDLRTQNVDIFEEGWYMGQENSKNTFMENVRVSDFGTPGGWS